MFPKNHHGEKVDFWEKEGLFERVERDDGKEGRQRITSKRKAPPRRKTRNEKKVIICLKLFVMN